MNEFYGDFMLCDYQQPVGWWCTRYFRHQGPCACRPRWWNIPARIKFRRGL